MLYPKKFSLLTVVSSALLVLVLGSCSAAEEPTPVPAAPTATDAKYGGILTMNNWGDPPRWETFTTGTLRLAEVHRPISGEGNLVDRCRNDVFALCANLAESWESNSDFTEWTFKIRDNVFWHDGTPFTAEDAKWWFDLALNGVSGRAPYGSFVSLKAVNSVDVVGGNSLRFTLSEPQVRLPWQLIPAATAVVAHPRHLMQPKIDAGNPTVAPDEVNYVATGPFKFEEHTKGTIIKVRKFEKYWEKDDDGNQLPYLDGIDYTLSKDRSVILAGFRSGRIDGTGTLGWVKPEQREILKADMGDKVYFHLPEAYPDFLSFNATVEPYSDIRVRKAFNLWYDRQSFIATVWGGDAKIRGLFPGFTPFANKDLIEWPGFNPNTKEADRKRAKELLVEAGYPSGFDIFTVCRSFFQDRCEFTVSELTELMGSDKKITMDILDSAAWADLKTGGGWTFNHDSPGLQMDPEEAFPGWRSEVASGQTVHNDPKVDEMFNQLANMSDGQERYKLGQALEKYVMQEKVYGIGLTTYIGGQAWRGYVKGLPMVPVCVQCSITRATVWLDK